MRAGNKRENFLLSCRTQTFWLIAGVSLFLSFGLTLTAVLVTLYDVESSGFGVCLKGAKRIPYAGVPDGYCAHEFASNLDHPRSIISLWNGRVLVLEGGKNSITILRDDNHDGTSDANERQTIAHAPGLNHGLALHGGYIYASSDTTVYRWSYESDLDLSRLGDREIVVHSMPAEGHASRTLVFDDNDRLYVNVGSLENVDTNSDRSGIWRFNIEDIPTGGLPFSNGTKIIGGVRNEVGLTFDEEGIFWGVENGVDDLARPPWGDIHNDNPGEELNNFGRIANIDDMFFYGYPYCWSEYNLPSNGKGRGAQWAHPDFMNDGIHTDEWCQNTTNVVRPTAVMPAHVAPLDIEFYYQSSFHGVKKGDAFVSWHGSWNRNVPQGYKVVLLEFNAERRPTKWRPFFYYESGVDVNGNTGTVDYDEHKWTHRPVGVSMGRLAGEVECLFISSDGTGSVFVVFPRSALKTEATQ